MSFGSFITFLDTQMETPGLYGWFHIMFLLIVIGASVLGALCSRKMSDRTYRTVCLAVWAAVVLLEVYKQVVYSFSVEDSGAVVFDFQWYAFPFQFCSTPYFTLPLVFLTREDSLLRKCGTAFLASFVMFAGLAVMLYPGDVFIGTVGINIQTMIHHGSMVALGVLTAARYSHTLRLRDYAKGFAVFAVLVVVAFVMNEAVYAALVANANDETFNMFFISRHFDCTLPVLSLFWGKVPYAVFVMIYFFGFAIAGGAIYALSVLLPEYIIKKRAAKCCGA